MATKIFDSSFVSSEEQALDLIGNILAASTEYSIIGKDLDGRIRLWNEGARLIYGYEPEDVVGKVSADILHTREDVVAGKPKEMREATLKDGKWEGLVKRQRKNGEYFMARVVMTPWHGLLGEVVGYLLVSKDISEELRLAQELRVTQFYTRALIESNVDALITSDPEGMITDINQETESLTGYSRHELIGSQFADCFTDSKRARAGISRVLQEGTVTDYELTARSKSGQLTVVSYNGSIFRDETGKLRGVFSAARDLTKLKAVSRYARSLIEASLDAMFTISPAGLITDVNEATVRATGTPRETLIGAEFADQFTEPEVARRGYKKVFSEGFVRDYPLAIRHAYGSVTDVLYNASIYRDGTGNVLGVVATARDVTKRKRDEAAQRSLSAYARSLIEAGLDPLVTISPQGAITDMNKAWLQATGRTREQLIGTEFSTYFTQPQEARASYEQVFTEGFVRDYPLAIRHQSGAVTEVLYNAGLYNDDRGEVLGVVAVARDVTERRRFEESLKKANRLKSEFLANMSHELRTPLNGIIGFTEFILDGKPGPLNPKQSEYLGDVLNSGKHLLKLINDVLDLSKVEAGKMDFDPETFLVGNAVDEVCAVARAIAQKKGIEIHTEIGTRLVEVTLDQKKFKQVLYNLLSNAVKFTNDGGRVDLSVGLAGRDRFLVRVTDNGIGISEADIPRLFREFEQLEAGASRRFEGSGLGLALTKKIVEFQGGMITVESKLGIGSSFTVELPKILEKVAA